MLDGTNGLRILRAVSEFSESFAQVVLQVAEEAATTPLIWFSDYSMIPVAGHFGRLTNNRYPVGISIRSSVGRTDVPQMTEQATRILAEGILAADFVSVHRRRDVYHLLELVGRCVGYDAICWEECTVASKRGSTVISDIPMGNCPDHWHTVGRSKIAIDTCQSVLDQCPSMQVVLSVSRLEHHKGIETELDVIDRLLRYFPDLRRTFVFYRIMPMFPEYSALSSYRQLNERIVDRIECINSKYGDPKWRPISLLSGPSLIHEELAGYYRAADVLMVLSHADGFNHVSLEAILAKQPSDRPLGLLLSDTGSADCLGESFMPAVKGSLTEMALQLSKILRRDQQSRTLLHDRLRAAAVVRSAADWTTDVLGSIVACHERAQLIKTD